MQLSLCFLQIQTVLLTNLAIRLKIRISWYVNSMNNDLKTFDIASFGELLIDFTFQGISPNGQRLFAQNPGGAPANVLVSAQRLGARCAFLGKVGNDMHGCFLKQTLEQEKIDTKGLILDDRYFTTLAFVNINENGERSFSFARKPGADTKMQQQDINLDILKDTRIFHVGSLSLTDEPSRATTFYAVKYAKENGSLISYDPNYRAALWENEEIAQIRMRSLIPYADVMKISDEETVLLTDESDIEKAAKKLYEQGVKVIAVTLGSKGAYIYANNSGQYVAPLKCTVKDTNGAGDSFWGGFLYKLSKDKGNLNNLTDNELSSFAYFANAVASLCVESAGAIPAMPYLAKVEERLKNAGLDWCL